MPHPVHHLLKRFLDSEQGAFDAAAKEYWPSERFVPEQHDADADHGFPHPPEPGRSPIDYRELEPHD